MFGGVADRYRLYKIIGEPFKDGAVYYVNVQPPFGGATKKVRWYKDAKHAANTPNPYKKPLYSLFNFKSKTDKVQIIKDRFVSDDEVDKYEMRQNGWIHRAVFGTCWITNQETALPPLRCKDKVFLCSWQDFVAESQRCLKENGITTGCWFEKEEVE